MAGEVAYGITRRSFRPSARFRPLARVLLAARRSKMPICASCGLEVARCGFTKAQLGKKDSRRCKQCLTTPDAPGTALVPHSSEFTEPVEDLEAALRELETHCALCAAPPPDGGPPWNRCGRCGVPSYCSRECQRMAWKRCELVRRAG